MWAGMFYMPRTVAVEITGKKKKTWACDRERNITAAAGLSEFFMNTVLVLKH